MANELWNENLKINEKLTLYNAIVSKIMRNISFVPMTFIFTL